VWPQALRRLGLWSLPADRPAGFRQVATRPLAFGAEGEARSDSCGAAACGRDWRRSRL